VLGEFDGLLLGNGVGSIDGMSVGTSVGAIVVGLIEGTDVGE